MLQKYKRYFQDMLIMQTKRNIKGREHLPCCASPQLVLYISQGKPRKARL